MKYGVIGCSPEAADVWATFDTDFPSPEPDPPDCAMPISEFDVRLRSSRSEMTENGSRQTRPSSRRNAKWDGPTSIWVTRTEPNAPPVWLPSLNVTPEFDAEMAGAAGSPKFPLRSRSPTSFSFSPSCSAEPGSGWTTNWSGMLTDFGMMTVNHTRQHFSHVLRLKIVLFPNLDTKNFNEHKKTFSFAVTNSHWNLEPWNQHSKQSKTHSKQHWSEEILINVGTQSGIQQCSKQDVTVLINLQKKRQKTQ